MKMIDNDGNWDYLIAWWVGSISFCRNSFWIAPGLLIYGQKFVFGEGVINVV